jgi:hypothetical protein
MIVWLIWVRSSNFVWLSDAWDDDTRSENPDGFAAAVAKAAREALENEGEMRVQKVHVPQVLDLFGTQTVDAVQL